MQKTTKPKQSKLESQLRGAAITYSVYAHAVWNGKANAQSLLSLDQAATTLKEAALRYGEQHRNGPCKHK